jgi:hypothetical protein
LNLWELKFEADIRAADLGHAWNGWTDDNDGLAALTRCIYCNAPAVVDAAPESKEYAITGAAVEIPCMGECPHPPEAAKTYVNAETGDTVTMCLWCERPVARFEE